MDCVARIMLRFGRWFLFIQTCVDRLAGVPSVGLGPRLLAVFFFCVAPTCLQAQTAGPTPTPLPQAAHNGSARVAGVIPAFNAENDVHAPALSSGKKFHLFTRTIKDPYNLVMPAL